MLSSIFQTLSYTNLKSNKSLENTFISKGTDTANTFLDEFCFKYKIFSKIKLEIDENINKELLCKIIQDIFLFSFNGKVIIKNNVLDLNKTKYSFMTEIQGIWFLKGFLNVFIEELFFEGKKIELEIISERKIKIIF